LADGRQFVRSVSGSTARYAVVKVQTGGKDTVIFLIKF
jgi:hypothetical protein